MLGGRVCLAQPAQGYRAAIDPVLLAASIVVCADERILDAGCGAGAAALCLATRLKDCMVTGVELEPDLAGLSRSNVAANGLEQRIAIAEMSFDAYAATHRGAFDQVMSNPPFYEDEHHTRSPRPTKATAHGEGAMELADWIKAAAVALKSRGRLTLIHRADRIGDILGAFQGRFGAAIVFPLWPKPGVEAKRILVTAIKGRRTLPRLSPGLVLHSADGAYSAQAEAILRHGAPLDFTAASA